MPQSTPPHSPARKHPQYRSILAGPPGPPRQYRSILCGPPGQPSQYRSILGRFFGFWNGFKCLCLSGPVYSGSGGKQDLLKHCEILPQRGFCWKAIHSSSRWNWVCMKETIEISRHVPSINDHWPACSRTVFTVSEASCKACGAARAAWTVAPARVRALALQQKRSGLSAESSSWTNLPAPGGHHFPVSSTKPRSWKPPALPPVDAHGALT